MGKLTGHWYFRVFITPLIGCTFDYLSPAEAIKLNPLGDGFFSLLKMRISPVIFCTLIPTIALTGLALILDIDRCMSEARALTIFIGNGVATVVVAHWKKEPDRDAMNEALKS